MGDRCCSQMALTSSTFLKPSSPQSPCHPLRSGHSRLSHFSRSNSFHHRIFIYAVSSTWMSFLNCFPLSVITLLRGGSSTRGMWSREGHFMQEKTWTCSKLPRKRPRCWHWVMGSLRIREAGLGGGRPCRELRQGARKRLFQCCKGE